jgi:hypothetical protein
VPVLRPRLWCSSTSISADTSALEVPIEFEISPSPKLQCVLLSNIKAAAGSGGVFYDGLRKRRLRTSLQLVVARGRRCVDIDCRLLSASCKSHRYIQ